MGSNSDSAEGKRRQRERNKAAAEAAGVKPTRSGSSGVLARLRAVQLLTFEEAQAMGVEHLTDVVGKVQQTQLLADGSVQMNVVVPPEWAQAAVDMHRGTRSGACFMRVYVMELPGDDDGSDAAEG